jgi:hypothetical protein
MSKFGVGVGDDFPVDDGNGQGADGNQPRDDRADYEEWKRRKEAHRTQREQWRAQREEWRQRKRAFKEKIRAAALESFGDDWEDYRGGFGGRDFGFRRRGFPFPLLALIPILGLVLIVALIAAIIKSPFVFLALVLVAFFFFAHRHHHHGHRFAGHGWHGRDRYGRDYDFDLKPSRGPQAPANNGTVATPPQTPPETPQDGGK